MATSQLQHGRVTWTDIVAPTPQDVDALAEQYPFIHPLHFEDIRSRIERPKIDEDENYLFVVMHFPLWIPEKRLTRPSEVNLFVGRGFLITVHDGVLKPLLQLVQRCAESERERERVMGQGANQTFYIIIDQLVDYIFPVLHQIDGNLERIEENIFSADTRRIIQDIAIVRRDINSVRRIIRHQVPIVMNLEGIENPIIHEDLEEYFGDIADHLSRARDFIEEDAELITSLADTADTLATHRINEVMRILTIISVTMLPLTLISSIYGMNIRLPFMEHPNAVVFVSGFMVIITITLFVYFRYRHWL